MAGYRLADEIQKQVKGRIPLTSMFDSTDNAFNSLEETSLESLAKAWINHEIETFGTVTKLEIGTSRKTIRLELVLKGEPSPMLVNAGSYELSRREGNAYITFRDVTASKEWVTGALCKYVAGRGFKIPSMIGLIL